MHYVLRIPTFISSRTSRKYLVWLIKSAVVIVLALVLYKQLFVSRDVYQLAGQLRSSMSVPGAIWLFLSVVILMPINWVLESLKWSWLVNGFQKFTLSQSIASVLAGVSMAILTPARLGEYGGRLVGIESQHRSKAILSNLVSSISQNIINIGLGILTTILFMQRYMPMQHGVFASLLSASAVLIGVLLLIYFRIDLLSGLLAYLPDYKWLDKIRQSVTSVSTLDTRSLFGILGISFVRYGVYVTQYVLLIYFFGVTDQVLAAFLGVGTVFFLQSNLPLPPVLSVLARGEMAIFLWSVFTDNVLGIVAATFTLWMINLVFPAIVGAIVISQAKILEDSMD